MRPRLALQWIGKGTVLILCWWAFNYSFGQQHQIDSLLDVAESTGSAELQGDIYQKLSRHYKKSNLDSSRMYIEKAIEIATDAGLIEKLHRYKMSQAALFWMQGNLEDAAKNYENALAFWRTKKNHEEITRCLLNLGTVNNSRGKNQEAISYLRQAMVNAEKGGLSLMSAQAAGTMASIFFSLEVYDSCFAYEFEAADIFTDLNDSANLARVYHNIGYHYREIGQSHSARIYYYRSVEYVAGTDEIGLKGEIYEGIGNLEYSAGNFKEAVESFLKAREFFRSLGWKLRIGNNATLVGLCFKSLGRNGAAREQFQKSIAVGKEFPENNLLSSAMTNLADLEREEGKFMLAVKTYREAIDVAEEALEQPNHFSRYMGLGLAFRELGLADSAKKYTELGLTLARERRSNLDVGIGFQDLAASSFKHGQFRDCITYLDSAVNWFSVNQHPRGLHDSYELRSQCLEAMGDFVGALEAQREAAHWRDSMVTVGQAEALLALEAQLWSDKKQHSLVMAQKNQEIQAKEKDLAIQTSERAQTQRNLLISILAFILLFGGALYYINLKRKENQMQQKISELRITALRSQMNPHFIFNALGSVQLLINTQKTKEANLYLSKFARLLRLILENSSTSDLTLEEEIEALKLYVELEALRFKFQYEFEIDESLALGDIQIPGMLIQPFVENAIKHGISGKQEEGRLKLGFNRSNGELLCSIQDNGIGRQESQKINREKGNHHSMGIQIIESQLELVKPQKKDRLSIIDLADSHGTAEGTRVEIRLPLNR